MRAKIAVLFALISTLFVTGCGGFVPYVQFSTDDCFGYVAFTNTNVTFEVFSPGTEENMTITWNDSRTGSFNVEVRHGILPDGLLVEFFSTSSVGTAYNGEYFGVVTNTDPLSFGIRYRDDGSETLLPGTYNITLTVEQEGCDPITIPVTVVVTDNQLV